MGQPNAEDGVAASNVVLSRDRGRGSKGSSLLLFGTVAGGMPRHSPGLECVRGPAWQWDGGLGLSASTTASPQPIPRACREAIR